MPLRSIGLHFATNILRNSFIVRVSPLKLISSSSVCFENISDNKDIITNEIKSLGGPFYEDSGKDRSRQIPVETSIKYMNSKAYQTTYGNDPVWKLYRRNHKGQIPPSKTRKTCIRGGVISTGSPCPICRDEYLVLHHLNVKLLKQFISEHNGEILSYTKTGICQKQYKELLVAITRAKDYGIIAFDVPLRKYDYSEWYTPTKHT